MAEVADLIFSDRVAEIKELFLPCYLRIEKERRLHTKREVAGSIFEGKLRFVEVSKCHPHSVEVGTYEEQRKEGEAGKLHFHTHRDVVINPKPSISDFANAAARGASVLVNKEGAFLLIAEKSLAFEEIDDIKKNAKLENFVYGEGDFDWEGFGLDLSIRVIKLAEPFKSKENGFSFKKFLDKLFEKIF